MRIVVIGDDGVGKSTLITCLFKDRYIPNIEDVLPTLFFSRSNDNSSVALVDTSPSLNQRPKLLSELRQANCIWLVYSDHYTIERVSLFWLPFLRDNGINLPIILCQNKQDELFHDHHAEPEKMSVEDEEDIIQLMQDFKEIESFIRCSAKEKCNVNEAFYLCQRAIVYPLAPLFDSKVGKLKPLARDALSRIFFLYDEDQSGYLDTTKLQNLQQTVFKSRLDDEEVQLIHETLASIQDQNIDTSTPNGSYQAIARRESFPNEPVSNESAPNESDTAPVAEASPKIAGLGLSSNSSRPRLYNREVGGITLDGFLSLAEIYCERGRHETIWTILRHFQYTDSLSLDDKFLRPPLHVDPLSHLELSPDGYQFLVDLFSLFDRDNDGGLSPSELDALFTPTPGLPSIWKKFNFPFSTLRNDDGYVTLQGWLAQWSMFVYLDHTDALAYIAMLGYNYRANSPDIKSALRVTKPAKKRNPRSRVYRNSVVKDRQVFNCFVFGKSGAGKSTLLSSFLGARSRTSETLGTAPQTVVNSVEMPGGKQSYLILQEFGSLEDTVAETPCKLEECDVVCLTYDSSDPNSFAYLAEFRRKHKELDSLPIIFAALKADQDRAQQRCDEQPDEFTAALGIAAPMHVSSHWPSSLSALFVQIVEAATHPGSATVVPPDEENESSLITELSVCGAVVVAASFTWWWVIHRSRAV